MDPLKITNEIWRKWDEKKVTSPMTWQQLRIKVEEYIASGKDPYTIGTESNPTLKDLFTGKTLEGYVEAAKVKTLDTFMPWPNMTPEAVVEEKEIPTFTPALLGLVEDSWKNKKTNTFWEWTIYPVENGVLVGLRGNPRPHELFPKDLIEKMKYSEEERKYSTRLTKLYFEDPEVARRAYDILSKADLSTGLMRETGLATIVKTFDPDAALEILASEGFDTSKIMVEKE